jgi:D-glycero-D-manno-heptose 1,7-bisphosphate phosphatase
MSKNLIPILCLDLDGTVRKSKSGTFISGPDDIVLMEGIEEAIWHFKNKGYLVAAISNQGGVAHGYKTPEEIDEELEKTRNLFDKNPFDSMKAAYQMEGGTIFPYNVKSLMRKPYHGMLVVLEIDIWEAGYVADWNNSLFVGDRPEDEECAANAGIAYLHIEKFLSTYHNY